MLEGNLRADSGAMSPFRPRTRPLRVVRPDKCAASNTRLVVFHPLELEAGTARAKTTLIPSPRCRAAHAHPRQSDMQFASWH
jgi:hypothetical protein